MSNDKENQEISEGEAEKNSKKKASSMNLMTFILIGIIVLLLGVVGFLFTVPGKKMLGFDPSLMEQKESEIQTPKTEFDPGEIDPKTTDFIPLPDILVNLSSRKTPSIARSSFLKLKLTLQIADEKDKEIIKKLLPLIIDQFQVFLRELDLTDIAGSEGLHRLKQELINRANHAIAPKKIINILFKEVLIQ
jgi:flagellar FliL protein